MTVVVANEGSHAPAVSYPGWFAPVDPAGEARGQAVAGAGTDAGGYSWHPERAPDGALTLVLSLADNEVVVMRNGVEIGRSGFVTRGGPVPGTHVYVLLDDAVPGSGQPSAGAAVPDQPGRRWMEVASIGGQDPAGVTVELTLGNG